MLNDLDLLRILAWLERGGKRDADNFAFVVRDDEYAELVVSPYVRMKSLFGLDTKLLRGLSDAGYDKLDELTAKYPRPDEAGYVTIIHHVDRENNTVTNGYVWGDHEIVQIDKHLITCSDDMHKYGGRMTIGPFDCRVIWEDDRTVYVVRDTE